MKKLFVFLWLLPLVAFAEVPVVVPDGDPLQALLSLILGWKAMAPLAIGSAIIVVVVQAMKKLLPEFKYKRLIVAVLGVLYGVMLALSNGMGVLEAAVAALFVSGGAVAIYEAIKPALAKLRLS